MEVKMSRAEKKMAQNSITTKDKEETGMAGMDSQETKTAFGSMAAGSESGMETGKGRKKKQKEPKIKKPMEKARKKKIIRRGVLGGVALVIVLFFIRNSLAAQSMGLMVSTDRKSVV